MQTHRRFSVVGIAVIAFLLGTLLLVLSYAVFAEHSFLAEASHEVGFALYVALVVWGCFEFFSREDNEVRWNDRIERMSKSVFFGVLRRNFPENLIKEARLLILDHKFLRSNFHITYTITDSSYVDRQGREQPFVRMAAVARFRVRNVSDDTARYPIGIILPNPMVDEMKTHCRVVGIRYRRDGGEWTDVPLASHEVAFQERLQNDTAHACPFEAGHLSIGSGQVVEFIFDYMMAKEEEDTEIFQTSVPISSLVVTVVDQGPTPRVVRARSIHVAPLEDDTSAECVGTYNFTLDRYLLPHQGFAVWWKKLPPATAGLLANQSVTPEANDTPE